MKLTFEELPSAISQLRKDVDEIKNLLLKLTDHDNSAQNDRPLNVKEAAAYLNLSVQTVYIKTSKGELPVNKLLNSTRNYYFQQDLLDYLKSNRKKSNQEIREAADNYLIPKKKRDENN